MPELRDYQKETVEWLASHPRAALFIEMGLGKTATVLASLTPDQLPALVVAPPRVAEHTWPAEARIWRPDLRVVPVVGAPAKRAKALATEGDVYVMSMTTVHTIPPEATAWRTLILDESSCFKSHKARRTKAVTALARRAEYVRILSGTPTSNSVEDLYSQMMIVDGGQRLGRTLTSFRQAWMREGPVVGRAPGGRLIRKWEDRPGAPEEIARRISDVATTLRQRDVGQVLPESFQDHEIVMSRAQARVYEALRQEFVTEVDGSGVTAPTAAALSGKLRQVLAGAVIPEDGGEPVEVSPDRVEAAVDLAYQVIGYGTGSRPPGNGVIIWYQFRAERDMILEAMKGQAVLIKDNLAIEKWLAGKRPVLVSHPASGGHGLNLQAGGHHDIWCSLPWSLEHWQQACARLPRPGQEHHVVHHVLKAALPSGAPTIDHSVGRALERKEDVAEAIMRGV